MELKIKKFDPCKISQDRVLVFIGKRNTGKSFLLRDILYYQKDIPVGTVISPTEKANPFYKNMIPNIFIHDEFSKELVANVIKRQQKVKKRLNKEKQNFGKSNINPQSFLILDDCLYDNTWKKDKNMRYLFQNGRHINILVLITMQYPLGILPDMRTNIDFTFILREPNTTNRKKIYENYASVFPNFDIFCKCMDNLTNGYGCLVIDNTARSNKLEEIVFWYTADDHQHFKLCSDEFWAIDNQYNDDDDTTDDEIDIVKKESCIIKKLH